MLPHLDADRRRWLHDALTLVHPGHRWLEALADAVALRGRALRDRAELLHHRHRVEDAPVLARETVVAEADDVDELDVDALARSPACP